MKKAKKKLTYKQMVDIMAGMDKTIQQQQMLVFNIDKLLQEYIDFKEETEPFQKFLEKKYETNDNDNKEVKEK
jgi:hypothetical protein|tara:strand:+ start:1531 stop:1749 length:219 start_codon:yes stop_codon:yes gene_type:complete